jgi:hypothetical protein
MEHYPEIWYLGLDSRKIHGEEGAPQNGGYDDENGSYHKVSFTLFYFIFIKKHSFDWSYSAVIAITENGCGIDSAMVRWILGAEWVVSEESMSHVESFNIAVACL